MNYSALNTAFQTELDIKSNSSAPGLTNPEIDWFLNRGQDSLVEELFSKSGSEHLQELLVVESGNLTAVYSIGAVASPCSNARQRSFETVNSVFFAYVGCVAKLTRSARPVISSAEYIPCIWIKKEDSYKFFANSYNVPDFVNPRVFIEGDVAKNGKIVVIHDSYTTLDYTNSLCVLFEYLKLPQRIAYATSTTCELKDILHKDVVSRAVEVALKTYDLEKAVGTVQIDKAL